MITQEKKSAEAQPETMSVKEFAEEMGWDPSTVTRAINTGRIKTATKRQPGMRRIPEHRILKSEVERLRNEAQSRQGE